MSIALTSISQRYADLIRSVSKATAELEGFKLPERKQSDSQYFPPTPERIELYEKGRVGTSNLDASSYFYHFDSNKDSILTKDELANSLNKLETAAANNKPVYIDPPPGTFERPVFSDRGSAFGIMTRASIFGQKLLDNFDAISKLDGREGLSRNDLSRLSNAYKNDGGISVGDFMMLERDIRA
jgi:hypothetical protein